MQLRLLPPEWGEGEVEPRTPSVAARLLASPRCMAQRHAAQAREGSPLETPAAIVRNSEKVAPAIRDKRRLRRPRCSIEKHIAKGMA